ncbi:alpha/beta hydrolase [Micromonospora sp. DR5-3]|uniref:alpha/beta fold hydrolase n=1 Tax=unclassified Micromonospora TaxID=2617518 RepID=UPI0011D30EF1|nr:MULTISPECIES: alpha/beta hydrolase [unclassified Micromonospora]MCW3815645.1 alpha/beta hydrolase [Micromonospora sp. DR5-3]TYC23810.1 alpha/beta hydrolase [Micromonospora sp. MP36]
MVTETDLRLGDGRTLHVYDTGGADRLAVFWHHGTPNIGAPPAPLFAAADRLGLRWVSHDRPGYGGSTRVPGRDVASAAADVAAVADALGIARFAVMGHSGGGPHALACGALLPDRVVAVVSGAGLAPYGAAGLDWFAGMVPSGVASLRSAAAGRAAKESYETSGAAYDPEFTPADLAALHGVWSWFGSVVGPATQAGPGGLIDDELAYVAPWGFRPGEVVPPVLLLHGGRDGIVPAAHGEWLAGHCPRAELRRYPEDGHISVLRHAESALDWLRERANADPVGA